jgi:hypothetical protein
MKDVTSISWSPSGSIAMASYDGLGGGPLMSIALLLSLEIPLFRAFYGAANSRPRRDGLMRPNQPVSRLPKRASDNAIPEVLPDVRPVPAWSGIGLRQGGHFMTARTRARIEPRLLSQGEAASYCGVSVPTFTSEFTVPPIKIRSRILYDRVLIDKWIDARSTAATEPKPHKTWLEQLDNADAHKRH